MREAAVSADVLLIDAFNLIRRIYEARPAEARPAETGPPLDEVVAASASSLRRALQAHRPSHACIVFDSHDTTWRHLLYPQYKMNRKPTPALLLDHLDTFRTAFLDMGVKSLKLANYEADDLIATLAHGVAGNGGVARILSTDRVFSQLLGAEVRIFNHFEDREVTGAEVEQRYGVSIDQLTDFWALAGDPGNNIKGVPKIGAKTAARLLAEYPSLEEILRAEDDNSSANRVRSHGDLAQRCKQLVTLKTDVALGINLKSLRLSS